MAVTHTDDATKTGAPVAAEGATLPEGVVQILQTSLDLYADSDTGDDVTGDGSIGAPWATMIKLVAEASKYVSGVLDSTPLTLHVAGDFTDDGEVVFRLPTNSARIDVIGAGTTVMPEDGLIFESGNVTLTGVIVSLMEVEAAAWLVTGGCQINRVRLNGGRYSCGGSSADTFVDDGRTSAIAMYGGTLDLGTINFATTIDYSVGFIYGQYDSKIYCSAYVDGTGSATGPRYNLNQASMLFLEGKVVTTLPGDAAGVLNQAAQVFA